ncbi:thioesterase II family protein [Brevibacillus dissolubilis]|uniref:thioesterase II family protein n=1 Tax=Brevibacillus dissolubilis TaxID=1844116 RepID=UPI00111708BD|nr:alpha/beta fold hydrolase [Brevibacillus dissolubilis]
MTMTKIKTKLFCLPYAGGSAAVLYGKWSRMEFDDLEVIPLELSGHGKRVEEPLYTEMHSMIEDLAAKMVEIISSAGSDSSDDSPADSGPTHTLPYAIFGHSMGALLSYELAHHLQAQGHPLPRHLFCSGGMPPHVQLDSTIHLLPERKFKKVAKSLLPPSFFFSSELQDLYLPMLKADVQLMETYQHERTEPMLDCDITVLYGTDDKGVAPEIRNWKQYTTQRYQDHAFPGGHFFVHDYPEEILQVIREALR